MSPRGRFFRFLLWSSLPFALACSASNESTSPPPALDGSVDAPSNSDATTGRDAPGATDAADAADGSAGDADAGPVSVTHLRTEYRVDPLGIDVAQPRFDYRLESSVRGEKQTAYRILAASSEARLAQDQGDLWDTGKVASDQTSQIVYGGTPLASRQTAWWKVQVWDKDGVLSPWSANASWELGLVAPSDWKAQWVSTASPPFQPAALDWIWYPEGDPATSAPAATRLFRRTFAVPAGATVSTATIAIAVDDQFDVYVNGTRAGSGNDWRVFHTFDVTSLVAPGSNTVAIRATNLQAAAGVLAQITLDLGTGTPLVVSTDTSFVSSNASPAPAGWEMPGFDDSAWTPAMSAAPYGQGPWGSLVPGAGGGGAVRYLRRSFTLGAPVQRARLYATALGLYEATINGQRVGVQHLTPGWTDYTQRVQVQTVDVTAALSQGENVVGLALADGWYQGKVGYVGRLRYGEARDRVLAQLEVALADGTTQTIATDATWDATTAGPIAAADLLDGETYDARREIAGWDEPGFVPGAAWAKAVVDAPASPPSLVPQPDEGIQVETTLAAVSMRKTPSGTLLYDLGQNIAGWVRLQATGPAGATLVLRHGEVLNPDGSLYTANLRGAAATDTYTLRGGTAEVYEPRFTIHGFRYVELSGDVAKLTTAPGIGTVTGVVAHAATPQTGTLVTSDANVNKLQSNILWSQKDNFTAVPTDCPQRDERLGWMGDAQIFAKTATLNMDVAAFYTKWLREVDGAQLASGAFTDVSPNPQSIAGQGTPAWGDAGVIVPWAVYLAYGDTRVLQESYPSMKAWVDYIAANNPSYLWQSSRGSDYGDWLNVNAETDHELLGTAFFAHSADIVSRAAGVLGNTADQAKYAALFASIRSAFAAAYVAADGHIASDTQTAYALALRFGLLSSAAQQAQAASLLQANIASHGGYLTTGFLGVGYLLPALSSAGMDTTAYGLLQNDGFPSWRYEIDHGATTTWERWDGIRPDGTFQDPSMNSFNHYSFGSVDEWMYGTIGGLVLDEAHPGWKAFVVRPRPGGGLTSARATLDSIHGTIVSDWKVDAGTFTLSVTVPVNTTATVYLPYTKGVLLDGQPPPAPGADLGYSVASGTYVFTAQTM